MQCLISNIQIILIARYYDLVIIKWNGNGHKKQQQQTTNNEYCDWNCNF